MCAQPDITSLRDTSRHKEPSGWLLRWRALELWAGLHTRRHAATSSPPCCIRVDDASVWRYACFTLNRCAAFGERYLAVHRSASCMHVVLHACMHGCCRSPSGPHQPTISPPPPFLRPSATLTPNWCAALGARSCVSLYRCQSSSVSKSYLHAARASSGCTYASSRCVSRHGAACVGRTPAMCPLVPLPVLGLKVAPAQRHAREADAS